MKFLEKIGLQKKKKEEEEVITVSKPKQSAINKISNLMMTLNQPMGGGIGFNPDPRRTPRERQLGIPEYISPKERIKDFSITPKEIPKPKKIITNWRPTPGKVSRKGEEVKW